MKTGTIIRAHEIASQITAFDKDLYKKEELLPELLELQRQLINLVFNGTHAELSQLRIWDVESHLKQMNEDRGNIADQDLAEVMATCKEICQMIKSEFSGNAGEKKAFWSLESVRGRKELLKNIEFKSGEHRAELDAIMITEKAVFVIEVKNPGKDIYIDKRGNYCRIGKSMTFDKNIGERMNDKIYFLRQCLETSGVHNLNIESIVVFTNNNIHVDNDFPYISTCFLSDLPRIIEEYKGSRIYEDDDITRMKQSIRNAQCSEAYPIPVDMKQFKQKFSMLLALLEEAPIKTQEEKAEHIENEAKTKCNLACDSAGENVAKQESNFNNKMPKTSRRKVLSTVGGLAALFGMVDICIHLAVRHKN